MKNFRLTIRTSLQTMLLSLVLFSSLLSLLPATASAMTPQQCQANGVPYDATTHTCGSSDPSGSGSGGSGGSGGSSAPSSPRVDNYSAGSDGNKYEVDPALSSKKCAADSNGSVSASNCDLVANYIDPAVSFLAAAIGIAVAAAVIYGGIEIGSSGGDPGRAASGKKHIRNALFTLIVFFFLYALLNFLIPGGLKQ